MEIRFNTKHWVESMTRLMNGSMMIYLGRFSYELYYFIFGGILAFEGAVDNFLSTSSMSSRTYGSRDRTFDFLDVEDDNGDLFDDALNVSTVMRKIFMKRGDDQMLMTWRWWQNFDLGDIFPILVPDVKWNWMLVTKMAKMFPKS